MYTRARDVASLFLSRRTGVACLLPNTHAYSTSLRSPLHATGGRPKQNNVAVARNSHARRLVTVVNLCALVDPGWSVGGRSVGPSVVSFSHFERGSSFFMAV